MTQAQRIPQLDGIRGVAILLVMIWHYVSLPAQWYPLKIATGLTWSGVDLFFVLSGFLIGGILLDNQTSPNLYQVFYARRALRILPLYWLVLSVYWLFSATGLASLAPWLFSEPLPLAPYLFFAQNVVMAWRDQMGAHFLDVTWSLAIEEHFYLVLPFLVRNLSGRWFPMICGVLIAGAWLCRLGFYLARPQDAISYYVFTLTRMDALFLGALAAWVMRHAAALESLQRRMSWLRAGSVLGVCFLGICLARGKGVESLSMLLIGYSAIGVIAVTFLLHALLFQGWASRLTSQRWLRRAGVLAYGLYLLHQPVSGFLHGVILDAPPRLATLPETGVTVLALVTTCLLAESSFRFLEQPCLRLGHRFRYS